MTHLIMSKNNEGITQPEECSDFSFQLCLSVRIHFVPEKIALTLELLGQFIRFKYHNDRHSHPVLLIY